MGSDEYVMVPREPTEEMMAAGRQWAACNQLGECYRAMLSAAPPSPRSDDGSGLTPSEHGSSAIAQERDVEGFAPGTHGCHEALHMASFFAAAVDESLLDHPAIARNPKWAALARVSVAFLADLYQAIGAEHMEAIPTTSPKAISEAPASADAVKTSPEVGEMPAGAIENGREFLRRIAEHYEFECEGGRLANCHEYTEAVRCFEHMAEAIIALDAERGRMREALKPFSVAAGGWFMKNYNAKETIATIRVDREPGVFEYFHITAGHLFAARAILSKLKEA